jgi:hypothetical protein
MKPPANIASLLLSLAVFAEAAPDKQAVRELELDERKVVTVPVSMQRVTSVSFPQPISAIDAALVCADGKTNGLFQLAHRPGTSFFAVRTLVRDAKTNVNVRCGGRTYILELIDSSEPALSLIFTMPRERNPTPIGRAVTPATLLGLLDRAKAFPTLLELRPDAVADVLHTEYPANGPAMEFDDYQIRIEEAYRFEEQDTLVFRLALANKTEHEIRYRPDGFKLRAGTRLFTQSISDASGSIPPRSESTAYMAVTGTPEGGRNDLSLKNEFTILLDRLDPPAEATQPVPPSEGPRLKTTGIKGFSK